MAQLQQNHADAQATIKRLQEEEKASRESINSTNQELERLRKLNVDAEDEKASLRQQVADLEEQLEVAKRTMPANGLNADQNNGGPIQPPATGLINLVSSKKPKPKRRSAFGYSNKDAGVGAYLNLQHRSRLLRAWNPLIKDYVSSRQCAASSTSGRQHPLRHTIRQAW